MQYLLPDISITVLSHYLLNNNNNYIYRALNTGVSKRTGGLSN